MVREAMWITTSFILYRWLIKHERLLKSRIGARYARYIDERAKRAVEILLQMDWGDEEKQ